MWRGSGYLLRTDWNRGPRHNTPTGTNRLPRYGSAPFQSDRAFQEHVGPGFIVDWIA